MNNRSSVEFSGEEVTTVSGPPLTDHLYATTAASKSKTNLQDPCDEKSPIEIVCMLKSLLSWPPKSKTKLLEDVRQFVDLIKITNSKGSIPDEYVSVPHLIRILFLSRLEVRADLYSTIEAENMDLDHLAAMTELDGETSFEERADESELCEIDPEKSNVETKCDLGSVSQIFGTILNEESGLYELSEYPNVSVDEAKSNMEIQIDNVEISEPTDFEITEFEANIQDIKEDIVDQPELNFNPGIESVDLEIPIIKRPKGSKYLNEANGQGEPKFRCTICDKFYMDRDSFKQHIGLKHMGFDSVTEWKKPENKKHRTAALSHVAFERIKTEDMLAKEKEREETFQNNAKVQFLKCLECVSESEKPRVGWLACTKYKRTQKDFIDNVVNDPSNALFSDLSQLKAHTNSAHPLLEDPMACYYQLQPSKTQTKWRGYKCMNCDVKSSRPRDIIRHLRSESHSCRNEVRRGDRVKAVKESGYIEAIEPPEGPVDVKAEDIKVDGLANSSFFLFR